MIPGWMERAACRGMGPDLWFGPDGEYPAHREQRVAEAKAICRSCPVRRACLDWALTEQCQVGVAGGMTATERAAERRRHVRRAS